MLDASSADLNIPDGRNTIFAAFQCCTELHSSITIMNFLIEISNFDKLEK